MEKIELIARYDRAKSFYKKAYIIKDKNILVLKSYDTYILKYNTKSNKIKFLTNCKWHFTQTTNRHINEFLKQFTNETTKTKKELLQMANAQ